MEHLLSETQIDGLAWDWNEWAILLVLCHQGGSEWMTLHLQPLKHLVSDTQIEHLEWVEVTGTFGHLVDHFHCLCYQN